MKSKEKKKEIQMYRIHSVRSYIAQNRRKKETGNDSHRSNSQKFLLQMAYMNRNNRNEHDRICIKGNSLLFKVEEGKYFPRGDATPVR